MEGVVRTLNKSTKQQHNTTTFPKAAEITKIEKITLQTIHLELK
jgi:hypothetical protein